MVNNKEEVPLSHYLALYKKCDPVEVAKRCALVYDEQNQQFEIRYLGKLYYLKFPEFSIIPAEEENQNTYIIHSIPAQILFIRYMLEGSNIKSSGEFKSYRDFPWGEVYFTNFRGRCIMRLTGIFGKRPEAFQDVMNKIGAKEIQDGDYGYEVEFINNLYIRFMLWEGDEEFSPSMQILFSENFAFAFSAEDMAVVGDVVISTLQKG